MGFVQMAYGGKKMRLVDADAEIRHIRELYCSDCKRRENGKGKPCYEIGDVPCRSCGTQDAVEYFEEADEIDAVPVVRCEDCKYLNAGKNEVDAWYRCKLKRIDVEPDFYCADGERRKGNATGND